MWGEGGLYKQVCDSGEFVGNLWAERERKREGEGERGGERGRGKGRGRGRERDTESEGGRERGRRRRRGGGVLWALGGNLCLAFEGSGSYNHPFVTSRKR